MTDRIAVGARVRLTWGSREGYHGVIETIEGKVLFVRLSGGRWDGLLVPVSRDELVPEQPDR